MSSLRFINKYTSNLDSIEQVSKDSYLTAITLDDVKGYLGLVISETYDDSLLTDLINKACLKVEKYINKSIVTSSYTAVYSSFADKTYLPYGDSTSVTSITLIDGSVLDTSYYQLIGGKVYSYETDSRIVVAYDVTVLELDPIVKVFVYQLVRYMYDTNTYEMPSFKELDCITRRPIF